MDEPRQCCGLPDEMDSIMNSSFFGVRSDLFHMIRGDPLHIHTTPLGHYPTLLSNALTAALLRAGTRVDSGFR